MHLDLSIILPPDTADPIAAFEFIQAHLPSSYPHEVLFFSAQQDLELEAASDPIEGLVCRRVGSLSAKECVTEALEASRGQACLVLPLAPRDVWVDLLQYTLVNPKPQKVVLLSPERNPPSLLGKLAKKLSRYAVLNPAILVGSHKLRELCRELQHDSPELGVRLDESFEVVHLGEPSPPRQPDLTYWKNLYPILLGSILPLRFIQYCTVSGSGVLVNLSTLQTAKGFGASDNVALIWAIEVSMTTNYLIHNFWTFRANALQGKRLLTGYLKFHLVNLIGGGIILSISLVLKDRLHFNILLSTLCGILVAMIWNYTFNKKITWKLP